MPPGSLLPVEYQPQAFAGAIAAVDAAIARLDGALEDRAGRVQQRLSEWAGTSRGRFDTYGQAILATHLDVLGELRATRRNLATTLDAIETENRRRAVALAQWYEEQRQAAEAGP